MVLGLCFTIGCVCASTCKTVLERTVLEDAKEEPGSDPNDRHKGILARWFRGDSHVRGRRNWHGTFHANGLDGAKQLYASMEHMYSFLFYKCVFDIWMKVMIVAKYYSCTKMLVNALAVCGTLAGELVVDVGHCTYGRRGIVLHLPFSLICVT